MARLLTTPCPACNTTEHPRYAGESICHQCRMDLAYAKVERARRAQEAKDSNKLTYQYHERYYATPRYCSNHGLRADKERLQRAFYNLILRMASPATCESVGPLLPPYKLVSMYEWRKDYDFKEVDAKAIQEMHEALVEYIESVGQAAYEKGHNLLLGLASGKTSANDFNDATTRKA